MTKYHINPETGRANICRATKHCPLGADTPHFDTKEEAKAYIENSAAQEHALFTPISKNTSKNTGLEKDKRKDKPFKPSFKNVKSKEETLRMIRNWKTGEYTRKQLDQMDLEYIDVDTSYGSRNTELQLSNDDNTGFMKGACLAWAYEAHLQHGGDFIVWTMNPGESCWEGHAALDLGDGKYFDAQGVEEYDLDSDEMYFDGKRYKNITCERMSHEEFKKIFEMEDVVKTYNNIGRYMLGYKVNDFLKEEGLL